MHAHTHTPNGTTRKNSKCCLHTWHSKSKANGNKWNKFKREKYHQHMISQPHLVFLLVYIVRRAIDSIKLWTDTKMRNLNCRNICHAMLGMLHYCHYIRTHMYVYLAIFNSKSSRWIETLLYKMFRFVIYVVSHLSRRDAAAIVAVAIAFCEPITFTQTH